MKEQPGTESWTLLTFEKFLYEQIGQPKKIAFKPEVEMGATLSNNDLHEIFGVGNMGDMRRSQKNNLLLIVSDHTKSFMRISGMEMCSIIQEWGNSEINSLQVKIKR